MKNQNTILLKLYIFIVLYSSLLRVLIGRWGTLISDIATILLLIYCCYNQGHLVIRYNRRFNAIACLILMVEVISIFEIFNPNITNTLYSLIEYRKSYFQLIAVIVSYLLFKKSQISVDEVLRYIGNASLPLIIYGIKQYFFWGTIDNKLLDITDSGFYTLRYAGHIRAMSIFSGPFHFGMFCIILFTVFLYLWQKKRGNYYAIYMAASILGCYCSITRTNFVCLIAVILLWYLFYLHYEKTSHAAFKKMLSSLLLFCMLIVLIFSSTNISTNNEVLNKYLSSLINFTSDSRFTGRYHTWSEGLSLVKEYPLTGLGVGAAADTMSKYGVSDIYITTHNMYLKLFIEIGILGGLLYLAIFAITIFQLRKSKDYKIRALYTGLSLCILLNGIVGSIVSAFPDLTLFWIIAGILVSNQHQKGQKIERIKS